MQTVTISQQDQRLRIMCSYIANSLAQGCQVTVCLQIMEGEVDFSTCSNHTFQRTSSAGFVPVSEPGTYVITDVASIEQDGTTSIIEEISVFGVLEAPPLMTSSSTVSLSTGGKSLHS